MEFYQEELYCISMYLGDGKKRRSGVTLILDNYASNTHCGVGSHLQTSEAPTFVSKLTKFSGAI